MALTDMVIMPGADYLGACDALRAKHGTTGKIKSGDMAQLIEDIPSGGGAELPELTNPGNADTMLYGYQLIDQNGKIVTGEIQSRTASNVIVDGKNVIVNAGHYKEMITTSVDTAEQATPSITVSASGLITAKATQGAGYVTSGTKQATKQLTTKAGTTVTPTTTVQTAVPAGTYVTGDIKVAAVPEDTGVELPELTNPGDGSKLLAGYQLIGQDGSVVDGEIVSRTASNLTSSGATVTVPAGHYAAQATKSVTTATQATPSITVSASGLITAKATQSSGYVSYGTKQATKQLPTQGASTVTPSDTEQTVVEAGTYVTGDIKVAAVTGGTDNGVSDDILDGTVTEITSQVTKLRTYALRGCTSLKKASFPAATIFYGNVFYGCSTLAEVSLPELTTVSGGMNFSTCKALTEIVLPKATSIGSQEFYNCTKLAKADFGKVTSVAASAFASCSVLETLILRNTTAATLANKSALSGTPITSGTGYIYVPSALVDTYKAATNWSNYADQFRAIEDYPEITGG